MEHPLAIFVDTSEGNEEEVIGIRESLFPLKSILGLYGTNIVTCWLVP